MFIKPIDASSMSTWQDHAGNAHFALQSRRANVVRSLFTGIASLSLSASSDTGRKAYTDYEFRIILRCPSRKADFVVAVDDTFEKIHTDWNWVERNLFLKLSEIDAQRSTLTQDQIDTVLLKQFEELTEEAAGSITNLKPDLRGSLLIRVQSDPRTAEAQAKIQDMRMQLIQIFPNFEDEVLLNFYACTFWLTDAVSARGQLCLTRNVVTFHGTRAAGQADDPSLPLNVAVNIPYKDVLSLEMIKGKGVLMPDSIQIGIKEKSYVFSLYFYRKEVFRTLCYLCNAAMHRLVKGAEVSLSASMDMLGKAGTTGDLSSNVSNRGGNLLMMGRSREDMQFFKHQGMGLDDDVEEGDFTDQRLKTEESRVQLTVEQSSDEANGDHDPHLDTDTSASASTTGLLRYSHISTASINSLDDLDTQNRNIEFRNLFRLPFHETITAEESPCYFYHRTTTASHSGNIYLSQNFLNFASLSATAAPASSGNLSISTSMLFDSTLEPTLIFVIPYPHIVSVKKQPPTALPTAGKLSNLSLSGYLQIFTKTGQEFWLSFGSVKSRDKFSDVLLQRMKQVDWRFDDDVIIGQRNGAAGHIGEGGSAAAAQQAGSPATPQSPSVVVRSKEGSSGSLDEYMSVVAGMDADQRYATNVGAVGGVAVHILQVGLKFLFDDLESEGVLPLVLRQRNNSQDLNDVETVRKEQQAGNKAEELEARRQGERVAVGKWNEYMEENGKDVCMIKDLRGLRELIVRTDGIPNKFRGDFWMFCTGAWYSRPDEDYYKKLVIDHMGRVGPFTEEIEKDVRRSLPEHPAYQSPIGIDALRRLLTAYSWRNPAIGYAQALNIISAVMLLYLREEDAFWMLCIIVERILPDHYTKTLVGSVVDQSVFAHLVQQHLPNLWAHLTKLYMDLSTISVPWFVCLYLNSVSLRVGVKFLDSFFLDGPKFLFWLALGILKVNERMLVEKGRDDDIFVRILKGFFKRLGTAEAGVGSSGGDEEGGGVKEKEKEKEKGDTDTMVGRSLYEALMGIVYGFAGTVTTETIETLRMRYRLKVVHQMEDTNRRSQTRNLAEQVSMSVEEIGVVYDEVRRLEFARGDEIEDEGGVAAMEARAEDAEEDEMRGVLIGLGGWGMVGGRGRKKGRKREVGGLVLRVGSGLVFRVIG
ncbi:hypothetical protein HDV00_012031 [Rhizophlyctis rosea]|nr:hypothetical protein HDV00_012031 [Rhizophlyctis rosea]